MTSVKCIIVDDDPSFVAILEVLVRKVGFLDLAATFNDPLQAVQYLTSEKVDLIFLDVEMPGFSGLEFVSALNQNPMLIFISAKKDYAFEAFGLDAIDYLIKPITDSSRFLKAITKASETLNRQVPVPRPESKLFIKVDSAFLGLQLNDILWVEAYGDYLKIITAERTLIMLGTMKSLEHRLPEESFVRVHRSFIVNYRSINKIDADDLYIGSKAIPVSDSYREDLMRKIKFL